MQLSKWSNRLAVGLPATAVEALKQRENSGGQTIRTEVHSSARAQRTVKTLLKFFRALRSRLPASTSSRRER